MEQHTEWYTWNTDETTSQQINSTRKHKARINGPIFNLYNLKWRISVAPYMEVTLLKNPESWMYLELMNFPKHIAKIHVNVEYRLNDTKGKYVCDKVYTKRDTSSHWSFGTFYGSTNTSSQVTFMVGVTMITVTDKNGNDVTSAFMKAKPTKMIQGKQEYVTVDQMKTFERKLDAISKQLFELSKHVNDIKINMRFKNNVVEEKKVEIGDVNDEFKQWVYKTLKLGQFYESFVENGIDNFTVLKLLTMNDLNQMGIGRVGHKIQIMHHVKLLRDQQHVENANDSVEDAAYAEGKDLLVTID